MSGDPLLGVMRDGDKGSTFIETEGGPIAPRSGLILEGPGREKTPGTFSFPYVLFVVFLIGALVSFVMAAAVPPRLTQAGGLEIV